MVQAIEMAQPGRRSACPSALWSCCRALYRVFDMFSYEPCAPMSFVDTWRMRGSHSLVQRLAEISANKPTAKAASGDVTKRSQVPHKHGYFSLPIVPALRTSPICVRTGRAGNGCDQVSVSWPSESPDITSSIMEHCRAETGQFAGVL